MSSDNNHVMCVIYVMFVIWLGHCPVHISLGWGGEKRKMRIRVHSKMKGSVCERETNATDLTCKQTNKGVKRARKREEVDKSIWENKRRSRLPQTSSCLQITHNDWQRREAWETRTWQTQCSNTRRTHIHAAMAVTVHPDQLLGVLRYKYTTGVWWKIALTHKIYKRKTGGK